MAKLSGVDVAKIIGTEVGQKMLADTVFDATLTKVSAGTRTPGNLTGGTNPTSTAYPCKGFIDTKRRDRIGGTMVEDGDVVIVLIGNTISSGTVVPEVNDQVALEGTTYRIRALDRDPVAATFTLVCS